MLDRTGYAAGHIELRADGLSGLADLPLVGKQARVYNLARRAERSAKDFGQLLHQGKPFVGRSAEARRDDDLGFIHRRLVFLGDIVDELREQGGLIELVMLFDHLALAAAVRLHRLHHLGADRGHLRPGIGAEQACIQIAAKRRPRLNHQVVRAEFQLCAVCR